MQYTEVDTPDGTVHVANFLDGIIVRPDFVDLRIVFVPGWKLVQPTGDMDGPALHRRPEPDPPTYVLAAMPNLGTVGP